MKTEKKLARLKIQKILSKGMIDQRNLSEFIGCSDSTISHWNTESTLPNRRYFTAIDEAYRKYGLGGDAPLREVTPLRYQEMRQSTSISIDRELHAKIKTIAEKEGKSLLQVSNEIVSQHFREEDDGKGGWFKWLRKRK